MAGTQRQKARSKQTRKPSRAAGSNGRPEPTPGEYAREALSEWTRAARYAAAAISPVLRGAGGATKSDHPPLKDRLNPAKTDKGGRLGDAADLLLDKTGGKAGTVASNFSLGSRMVRRLRGGKSGSQGGSGEEADEREGGGTAAKELPIPIQESMEVAIPVKAVYELVRRFEDYPEFIPRIEDVERVGVKAAVFEVKVRGVKRSVRIEIADERPNRRIDWEGTEGLEHLGVVSFHELAPSLTHVELTIDVEPRGLIQRLSRTAHLTQHAIHSDMHRFKAWAELAEDVEEPEGDEEEETAGAIDEEERPEDYEDEEYEQDEGEEEVGPEDEEELPEDYEEEALEDQEVAAGEDYDQQDMEYESYDDEDEPVPARAG